MKKNLPTSTSLSVNKSKGFTLVELLVVVAIIAILAVVGLTIFGNLQKDARDARRKADIEAISKVWESRYTDATPHYPALSGTMFGTGSIPKDPKDNTTAYTYTGANETSGSDTYKVCADIESSTTDFCLSNQR